MTAACEYCGGGLPVSRQPKRFCSAHCRSSFHLGCSVIGRRQFEAGLVTIEQIRAANQFQPTQKGSTNA